MLRFAKMFSLLAATMIVLAGCTPTTKAPPKIVKKAMPHDHPHEGPHGGALVEWGEEEYHLEFTVDHKKQEARVYVFGPDINKAVAIKAAKILLAVKDPAFQIDLIAEPQKDDPAGSASVFVGKHEKLGIEREFAGTVTGQIDGKAYAGDFEEEAHDHKHDHKHDHDAKKEKK